VLSGAGKPSDLDQMLSWAEIALASRCGLGHTACNPVVSTLRNFRHLYEARIRNADEQFETFDLAASVAEANKTVGRRMPV